MTSKSLCFKLMKEDVKRRGWMVALTILGIAFAILIPVAIKSGEFMDLGPEISLYRRESLRNQIARLLTANGFAVVVLLTVSVLWAVSGFQYLHNRKKVDFFHSIPVKRHQLFLVNYINGIVIPGLIYLFLLIPSVLLAYRAGIGADLIGMNPWKAYLFHMVYYRLMYTTTVTAMMMTGNVVIALLGTGVFCGYGPGLIGLTFGYLGQWFHTFFMSAEKERQFVLWLFCSSPFSSYMGFISDFEKGTFAVFRLFKVFLITIALAVACCMMYRRRPLEAAGKAMAFRKTQLPIKVLLVIPVSVAFGMFFYILRSTVTWLIFGTVCGCVLSHCLIEIIYHFDFRKLFSNKLHLAACGAASVLLMLAGKYDWYGYDTWIPNPSKVESASILFDFYDDWVCYGQVNKVKSVYDGEIRYQWGIDSPASYCLEQMELSDVSPVLKLAEEGVKGERERRKNRGKIDYSSEWFTIQYCMTNGKKVSRCYRYSKKEGIEELYRQIYDSQEYKEGTYPILKKTAQEIVGVYVKDFSKPQKVEADEAERSLLLETYQKEWRKLTMEERQKTLPIGSIQFRSAMLQEAYEYNRRQERDDYLASRDYYPIYPSFTETIKLLNSHGVELKKLSAQDLSSIRIYYYQTASDDEMAETTRLYDGKNITYKEKEDLEKLAPALCYREFFNMGGGYYLKEMYHQADVTACIKEGNEISGCLIDLSKMTKEEVEHYGFYTARQTDELE